MSLRIYIYFCDLILMILVLQHIYELLGMISEKYPIELSYDQAIKLRLDLINAIEAIYTDDRSTVSASIQSTSIYHLDHVFHKFSDKRNIYVCDRWCCRWIKSTLNKLPH